MTEHEEYTPDLGSVRTWYSGAVGEYRCDTGMSEEEGEAAFDRAIAAHDRALREQIARDIEVRIDDDGTDEWFAAIECAARIARKGGQS
jgi:hypothetical protein